MDTAFRTAALQFFSNNKTEHNLKPYNLTKTDLGGATEYVGFTDNNGNSLITSNTSVDMLYFKGLTSGFSADWTGRAGLVYVQPHLINW